MLVNGIWYSGRSGRLGFSIASVISRVVEPARPNVPRKKLSILMGDILVVSPSVFANSDVVEVDRNPGSRRCMDADSSSRCSKKE